MFLGESFEDSAVPGTRVHGMGIWCNKKNALRGERKLPK